MLTGVALTAAFRASSPDGFCGASRRKCGTLLRFDILAGSSGCASRSNAAWRRKRLGSWGSGVAAFGKDPRGFCCIESRGWLVRPNSTSPSSSNAPASRVMRAFFDAGRFTRGGNAAIRHDAENPGPCVIEWLTDRFQGQCSAGSAACFATIVTFDAATGFSSPTCWLAPDGVRRADGARITLQAVASPRAMPSHHALRAAEQFEESPR